jgi:hypothetical protein
MDAGAYVLDAATFAVALATLAVATLALATLAFIRTPPRTGWDTYRVIPTLWLVGLAIGRWWAIPVGALGWTILVGLSVSIAPGELPAAAVLGAANVAAGVLVRWTVARLARGITRRARAA